MTNGAGSQELVNVHFGELVLRRALLRACGGGFVRVAGVVLCPLLAVHRPVLRLLLLGRLHLGLGFRQHGVAGGIKLLNRDGDKDRVIVSPQILDPIM